MLQLNEIVKNYKAGDTIVPALKGITLNFRKSEFVAILGPSGCGKTTLLNIIGGLDRYSSGDLLINGISTKCYKDKDWDTYRNHEIGFVFQSYNLIPHLTVLGNVELALTLSGMAKTERRKLAKEALEKVGLQDQIHKRPSQLSGGQMQRVAIARAIVNHPHIILADEPTGALDTETSLQVMEILKEISKNCLVIMVTHNPSLANQYATRIVELLDGTMKSDSDPYIPTKEELLEEEKKRVIANHEKRTKQKGKNEKEKVKVKKHSKMSFFTALTLSFKNLLTKKGRTFLISFAGSIGIIGISLVLSISNGFSKYIDKLQNDMLSGYPVTISRFAADYDAIENIGSGMKPDAGKFPDEENLYIYDPTDKMTKAVHLNLIDQEYVDFIQAFYTEDQKKSEEDEATNTISYFLPAKYNKDITEDLSSYYASITYPEDMDFTLHVVGVLRLSEDAPLDLFNSGILYHPQLTQAFIADAKTSAIAQRQEQDEKFMYGDYRDMYNSLGNEVQKLINNMEGNEYKLPISIMKLVFSQYVNSNSYMDDELLTRYVVESAKQTIGSSDVPSSIYIYPKSFAAKKTINAYLDSWNEGDIHQGQKIIYTDAASVFSTTLGQMVDIISYVLIAFTAISLVVSSIMIGIITYVSVIERTKEIGVLRSLGARKRDISSVFNAETLLIGLVAGLLGVIVTYVLCIPINILIRHLAGPTLMMNLAVFHPFHAFILLCVSMLLTIISGLIPSRIAAKKDPVIALRTE